MKMNVVILAQHCLSHAQKEEMWAVYKNYYHYSKGYFMERIKKNTHFALYQNEGKIGGFTGLRINKFRMGSSQKLLIYFGQTVISYGLRGKSLIPATGIKLLAKYWKELLTHDAWFWFDALSYKAYLVPAKALTNFYPSARKPMPAEVVRLRNILGEKYYGASFCRHTGTVKKTSNCLNDATVKIFKSDLADKDIAFFAQANPNHERGHGLLTLAPINWANIGRLLGRSFFRKLFSQKQTYKQRKLQPQLA